MGFEWQTEDEGRWTEEAGGSARAAGGTRRRGLWLIILLLLIPGATFLGWRQIQERTTAATDAVKGDVRASHDLAEQTAQRHDDELFVALLSGRASTWTEAQKERLKEGLLFGETAGVFGFVPEANNGLVGEISLSADLLEATVQVDYPYQVTAQDGAEIEISLRQELIYRKGLDRWLLSPPRDEFWGRWRTISGARLTLVYSMRDEEVALRLFDDVDRALVSMCTTTVACESEFKVDVRLAREPRSIVTLGNPFMPLEGGDNLELPAPTLVGVPLDEAGYQAVYEGYARHVLAAALLETADYECCDHAILQQAILARQLAQLRVAPPPVAVGAYVNLVDAPSTPDFLGELWQARVPLSAREQIPLVAHALLSLFENQLKPGTTLRDLQVGLAQTTSFSSWLAAYTTYQSISDEALAVDWAAQRVALITQAQEQVDLPAGLALPQERLVAACQGGGPFNVHELDPQTGEWQLDFERGMEFSILAGLPDDGGYALAGQLPTADDSLLLETWLNRTGHEPVRIKQSVGTVQVILPFSRVDPTGKKMLGWLFEGEGSDTNLEPTVVLFDPETCASGECVFERLPGIPLWSPDGTQKLYLEFFFDRPTLYLQARGATSWEEVGTADSGFWLDDETYGYVKNELGQPIVMIGSPGSAPEPRPEFGQALVSTMQEASGANQLAITIVQDNPWQEGGLIVVAQATARDRADTGYLFAVRRVNPDVPWQEAELNARLLAEIPGYPADARLLGPLFSSQRRWLTLPIYPQSGGSEDLFIYDLQSEDTTLIARMTTSNGFVGPSYDWSADGQWLARPVGGGIDMVAPGFEGAGGPVRRVFLRDGDYCSAVAWVRR